jgi:hypothetical protein
MSIHTTENWNLLGNWTVSNWSERFHIVAPVHLDMTIIEVTDTYIHARGRIWSTTDRTDWLAPATFEMDFNERYTRLNRHQTAMMWDENAGLWSDGDSNNSYLVSLQVEHPGASGPRVRTFNISFWRDRASISLRGFDFSRPVMRTGS